jgi:peptidoglycan/xylan/chitin deacetylase (PgdA/CDA1 family)
MTRTLVLLAAAACGAFGQRQVAITIDDLPLGGAPPHNCEATALAKLTSQLLAPLQAAHAPVMGFVIGQNCPESFAASLRLWTEAGYELGNHTYSHHDLNETPLNEFEADTVKGEKTLMAATGQKPRYFRHPFLHTGGTAEKRAAFEKFLTGRGYTIAPVTLDNSDWMFAAVYGGAQVRGDAALAKKVKDAYVPYMESIFEFFEKRSMEVVGREFPQVLLIHVSQLNAEGMPELLTMMKRRGYRFVSLEAALKDDAYRLPNTYSGKGGFSWLHRWSATKGMPNKGEPDEPRWITEAFAKQQKGKD